MGTLLVELIELGASQHNVALAVHGDDLLSILAHEKVLAEDNVVKDAADTEDIANGMRLSGHVLDVDDLRSDVAGRATSHK
jgi:hypothetical protein